MNYPPTWQPPSDAQAECDRLRSELEDLKKKYRKDVDELNQRLINRREAYEEYYAKVKKL